MLFLKPGRGARGGKIWPLTPLRGSPRNAPRMKIPFYISVAASALCLILSLVVFAVGNSNHSLQLEAQKQQKALQAQQQALQEQQREIDAGNQISQQIGPNLLRDMAASSVKNTKMKDLLAKHGYNVQVKDATPAPGTPAPKPATPPIP